MSPALREFLILKIKRRCGWLRNDPLMMNYHDREWGVPLHDDQGLFEFLVLSGTQAGLNWSMILNKRENYRRAFDEFKPEKVARYTEKRILKLLKNPGIIRNRMKVQAAIKNAGALLKIQDQMGSFDEYIWGFVDGRPLQNRRRSLSHLPARTGISDQMSRDLRLRGFQFVGSTICYAFMQTVGIVNDHMVGCYRHRELRR